MAGNPEGIFPKFAVPRKTISNTRPEVNNTLQSQTTSAINPEVNTTHYSPANSSVQPEVYHNRTQPSTASLISPEVNIAPRTQANASVYPEVDDTIQPRSASAIGPEVNTALYAQANSTVYPEVIDNMTQRRTASMISPEVNVAHHAQANSSVYPEINPINYSEKHGGNEDDGENDGIDDFTVKEQRLIIHRIDRRLVLILGILYAVSVIDRINVSFALITYYMDYNPDFYTIAYNVFFITYIVLQPVATVLIRTLGSRPFLAGLTLAFGLVTLGTAFVQKFDVICGLRVLLGAFQAGILSCSIYLISSWYHRYDVGKRFAFFYSFGCLAILLSGFVSVGDAYLPVAGSLNWVFIVEGIITCIVAIVAYFFIVDFPDKAYKKTMFLTDGESRFIIKRINKDRGDSKVTPFKLSEYLKSGLDLKVWGFALLFFANTAVTYSLGFFMPIVIVEDSNIGPWGSLFIIIGSLVFAIIITIIVGIIGDRTHSRGPIIFVNALLQFIGSAMAGYSDIMSVRIIGLYLTTAGANANLPAIMAYQANNIRGQWKRAFTSAVLVAFGGIGEVAGSLIFRFDSNPNFSSEVYDDVFDDYYYDSDFMELGRHGIWASMVCALASMTIVGLLSWKFFVDNRKEARGQIHLEKSEMGFRYTY